MAYRVNAADLKAIVFNEDETVASVLQNIAVILTTPKGSVPQYRSFGLSQTFLDKPTPQARVMMIAEVRDAVEEWEPRASVRSVSFAESATNPGQLIPTVEVEIRNEQES